MVTLVLQGHHSHYEMQALCMLFFGRETVHTVYEIPQELPERCIFASADPSGVSVLAVLDGNRVREAEPLSGQEAYSEVEWALGRCLYRALRRMAGREPPWGILTGVRPVKLFRQMLEDCASEAETLRFFEAQRYVSPEKAALAAWTAKVQIPLLHQDWQGAALYVSIPFCPSRCRYCSFVSHSIERARNLVGPYLDLLETELCETAAILNRYGIKLPAVYFGGGTPTVLEADQLERLLAVIAREFSFSGPVEYTVEAGRPDTITPEKLETLRRAGVNRISVNPQTLQDEVLRLAGRRHSAQQAVEGFRMARQAGFETINMDLIAGLEGDAPEGFRRTLEQVLELRPENVTVHTLSVKRAATLASEPSPAPSGAEEMVRHSCTALRESGYQPYYLYRQKNMTDNLENTGWSLPGHESLYNIHIMDEDRTIVSVGAGGVTKLVRNAQMKRIFHFKYPYEYINRFGEMRERLRLLESFFAGESGGG